jgi:hypothetical protein
MLAKRDGSRLIATTIIVTSMTANLFACSYCSPDAKSSRTIREEMEAAQFVVLGRLENARLDANQQGRTDVVLQQTFKSPQGSTAPKSFTLERYVPLDSKNPTDYLLFAESIQKRFDAYRGIPVKSQAFVQYVSNVKKQIGRNSKERLLFFFEEMGSPQSDVSLDAFLEFAKASDKEIAEVAPSLDRILIRQWILDPKTPRERISLFAYLLGAVGKSEDAAFLNQMLDQTLLEKGGDIAGLMGGLIELDAKLGWQRLGSLLNSPKTGLNQKLAAINTIRFFQVARMSKFVREQIVQTYSKSIADPDVADMIVEDLRRWQWWEATNEICKVMKLETHQAPILQRAILRYLIRCPLEEAKALLQAKRLTHPELVQDVEESISFERK